MVTHAEAMRAQSRDSAKNPRGAFALELELLLHKFQIAPKDYATLGAEIAAAQRPPRVLPYADFTVQGWVDAELLPTKPAYEALVTVLKQRMPELGRTSGVALWPNAALEEARRREDRPDYPYRPTEMSHALLTATRIMHKTKDHVAGDAKAWLAEQSPVEAGLTESGEPSGRILPVSASGWSSIFYGRKKHTPSLPATFELQRQLDVYCQTHPEASVIHLPAVHEQALRERADQIWQKALDNEKTIDLGGLVRACRIRLGEHYGAFGRRIIALSDKAGGDYNYDSMAFGWEHGYTPIGTASNTSESLCHPMVAAMKLADHSANGLADSLPESWFTPEKELILRTAFHDTLVDLNRHYVLPSLELSADPDPEKAPAITRNYPASLRTLLIRPKNGRPTDERKKFIQAAQAISMHFHSHNVPGAIPMLFGAANAEAAFVLPENIFRKLMLDTSVKIGKTTILFDQVAAPLRDMAAAYQCYYGLEEPIVLSRPATKAPKAEGDTWRQLMEASQRKRDLQAAPEVCNAAWVALSNFCVKSRLPSPAQLFSDSQVNIERIVDPDKLAARCARAYETAGRLRNDPAMLTGLENLLQAYQQAHAELQAQRSQSGRGYDRFR